jgi:LPS sulfotransferase NodH
MLCGALAATGALATPLEYFNPVRRRALGRRWHSGSALEAYVDALHARRTTPDGLFAAKLHWDQFVRIRAEAGAGPSDRAVHATPSWLLDWLFPTPRFVRIVRHDLDRQAVSYWRAQHSGKWSADLEDRRDRHPMSGGISAGDAAEIPYSFEGIDRCRRAIENGERCWARLLRAAGAEPIVVSYEDLVSEFEPTIRRVAEQIRPGLEIDVAEPRTRRLSDDRSLELLETFREQRRRKA